MSAAHPAAGLRVALERFLVGGGVMLLLLAWPRSAGAQGEVVVADGTTSPASVAAVPVTLRLGPGTQVATLQFNLTVVPQDGAPQIENDDTVSFTPTLGTPTPVVLPDGTSSVLVGWFQEFSPHLTGTVVLGNAEIPIPAAARDGDRYVIEVLAPSATSDGATEVPIGGQSGAVVARVATTSTSSSTSSSTSTSSSSSSSSSSTSTSTSSSSTTSSVAVTTSSTASSSTVPPSTTTSTTVPPVVSPCRPGVGSDCDDADPCTDDSCTSEATCRNVARPGHAGVACRIDQLESVLEGSTSAEIARRIRQGALKQVRGIGRLSAAALKAGERGKTAREGKLLGRVGGKLVAFRAFVDGARARGKIDPALADRLRQGVSRGLAAVDGARGSATP